MIERANGIIWRCGARTRRGLAAGLSPAASLTC
uniref:Uncharacterized protein n=1 Tax=Anguilla anguilla TaxID=7936 RepID=A0A0E9TL46_ANGAN